MRLPASKIIGLLLFSVIFGFFAQKFYISDSLDPIGFYNKIGFALLIPVFVILFILFLELTKQKNKFIIILWSSVLFLIIFSVNFMLYSIMGGSTSEMYPVVLAIGSIPSMVIGACYGLFFAFNLDK